jgi:hypothetical protein
VETNPAFVAAADTAAFAAEEMGILITIPTIELSQKIPAIPNIKYPFLEKNPGEDDAGVSVGADGAAEAAAEGTEAAESDRGE